MLTGLKKKEKRKRKEGEFPEEGGANDEKSMPIEPQSTRVGKDERLGGGGRRTKSSTSSSQ